MAATSTDTAFSGSVPRIYETCLVPLIFRPYAEDLAARLAAWGPASVLEIAAGTGVATRAMSAALAPGTELVATDLNQAMIDMAVEVGTARPVRWRQADACRLPADDASFEAVVCQFGAMFFPDKPAAFREARRVLRPGGRFVFSTWERIEANAFADTVTRALAALLPSDPPRFLARTPHGYHDAAAIERDLRAAGFEGRIEVETVAAVSAAESPGLPAFAYCQGTPLRAEIAARAPGRLDEATRAAERAIADAFGPGPVRGPIQALVVTAVA